MIDEEKTVIFYCAAQSSVKIFETITTYVVGRKINKRVYAKSEEDKEIIFNINSWPE